MTRSLPDPRVVFALTLILSSFAVIIRESLVLMAIQVLIGFIFALAINVDFRMMFRRLKRLWQALILVSILRSIFMPSGLILLEIAGLPIITLGGIQIGVLVLLRLALFIMSGAMFTCFTVRVLIQGMVQIKMPYEVAYMISVGVRFVPQLAQELKDSLTALQLRGIVIEELKLRKKLALYTYLILPVVVSSMQNAKELAMSMEMRAFRAQRVRTSFFELSFNRRDYAVLGAIAAYTAAMGAILIIGVRIF
ncbi:MAG: energy-coupling factor transporter transmembrane protein EcfT [Oscillospiraceae bacterium]|nr:energy-coupling factor transporter transmembrane protein EcfT [Oscillospiraceae bacterium]